MKLSPISNNQNNPNFKAVWSKQTLETAKAVSEESGVDLVGRLNTLLDSNPSLKRFGGDKVELSIHSKCVNKEFEVYHVSCQASISMPDEGATFKASCNLNNYGSQTHTFDRFKTVAKNYYEPLSERGILTLMAKEDYSANKEIGESIARCWKFGDIYTELLKQIENTKTRLITDEYERKLQEELSSQVPAMDKKLSDYLEYNFK